MLDRVDQMTHSLAGEGPTPGSSLTTALSLSLILVRLLRLVLTWTRLGHVAMRDKPDTSVAFLFSQVQSESVTFRDVFPPCVVSANQAALPSRHEAAGPRATCTGSEASSQVTSTCSPLAGSSPVALRNCEGPGTHGRHVESW